MAFGELPGSLPVIRRLQLPLRDTLKLFLLCACPSFDGDELNGYQLDRTQVNHHLVQTHE
ncbi:hypothetical protein CWC00_08165 [Pseudoalteromonas rubra]|nr:hypothetical protein CWC00_08165 [Pseudoalteromonas rubra]